MRSPEHTCDLWCEGFITATMPAAMQPDATSCSLDLFADYAQTLNSLPLDLSCIFADLRELDAVPTSTVTFPTP